MNRIEAYINSVYKNVQENQNEVQELKQEMRSHLLQTIEELKNDGKTEEESIDIAISRFGECSQIENELSKVFKVRRKFVKTLLIISIASLLLSAICFISYRITDNMFQLKIPESFKTAINYKLEVGEPISDKEVIQLLTEYKKQFRYVGIYKEDNYSEVPNILYPSNFSVEEIENDQCNLNLYSTSSNGTVWKVKYGFDYNGFYPSIPIYFHYAAIMLFIVYWLLFSTSCAINAHYKKNLSLVWVILFFTLNMVGYIIYILDKTSDSRLKFA